jgi:hypothetical protein
VSDIELTTLRWAPPAFQGQVRDLAVRWALEEAGLAYRVLQLGDQERSAPEYLAFERECPARQHAHTFRGFTALRGLVGRRVASLQPKPDP